MLTMLVAYKQLSPGDTPSEAVKKLVAILNIIRASRMTLPLHAQGFDRRRRARWLLCRASVWPDQIRIDRENEPSYPPSRPSRAPITAASGITSIRRW